MEIWKTIKNTDGQYDISNEGRVRSYYKIAYGGFVKSPYPQRILKPHKSAKRGYLAVGLIIDGKHKQKYIHHLVLENFIGDCPRGMECCHADDVPVNNLLSNLRWDTRSKNIADRANNNGVKHQDQRGEKHPLARLTNNDIYFIRSAFGDGVPIQTIATSFDIPYGHARNIVLHKSWAHI